ncbi:unnamed protein product [Brassica rapa subsp. trilocularis]
MATPRLLAAHITLNLHDLSLSRISGIEDGLILGGVSWFVMFAPLHCGRLASLVSSYCCMVLVWRQALVINYFCAGSETVCSEFSGNLNPVFRRLAFGGDVLRALFSSPV